MRPENLQYAVNDKPPLGTLALLGLQQVCVLSIYLVIIVIVSNEAHVDHHELQKIMSTAMVVIGIGGALQAMHKGPIGSGYLAPPVISAIYLKPSLLAASLGGIPAIAGMTLLSGIFESSLSFIFRRLRLLFPPVVSGLIVITVGFELGIIGTGLLLDVKGEIYTELYLRHFIVSILTLAVMLGLTIWAKGLLRLLAAMTGIFCGWIFAFAAGLIHADKLTLMREAPLIDFPSLAFSSLKLEPVLIVPFLIAGLAASLRSVGVITTAQKINDTEWKRPETASIKKGILADGLGCTLAGLMGIPGLSCSPSSVGISQVTGATSRLIAYAVMGWFIFFPACRK